MLTEEATAVMSNWKHKEDSINQYFPVFIKNKQRYVFHVNYLIKKLNKNPSPVILVL